jgi:RNA polymerase sigma-B factor
MNAPHAAPPSLTLARRSPGTTRDRHREALLFRRYCATRDASLREELVQSYLPLARSIARRYASPRVPSEDLVQVAAIGLMKAIDRFEPGRGIAFSSYAVPTMVGEVQRHFRDYSWGVRPPRELQERAQRVSAASRELEVELGRAPTPAELAGRLQLSLEQVVEALQAGEARDISSLDRPRGSEEDADTFAATFGTEDPGFHRVDQAVTAQLLMAELDDREREVLHLRFHEDLTQSEIGKRIGCSQMHVSRLVRRALAKLAVAAGA